MKMFQKKVSTFKHEVKGIGQVETTCKTFGNPIVDAKGNPVSACAKCKQTPEVIRACMVKAGIIKIAPPRKPTKAETGEPRKQRGIAETPKTSPYFLVCYGLSKGYTKEKILKKMEESGISSANAKNKYSSVSCCYNAIRGEARRPGSIQQYVEWILAGRTGTAPKIDAGSKSYTEKVYATMKQMGLI